MLSLLSLIIASGTVLRADTEVKILTLVNSCLKYAKFSYGSPRRIPTLGQTLQSVISLIVERYATQITYWPIPGARLSMRISNNICSVIFILKIRLPRTRPANRPGEKSSVVLRGEKSMSSFFSLETMCYSIFLRDEFREVCSKFWNKSKFQSYNWPTSDTPKRLKRSARWTTLRAFRFSSFWPDELIQPIIIRVSLAMIW